MGRDYIRNPKEAIAFLEVDAKVIVWHEEGVKHKRYFKRFDDKGRIVCFSAGATSWSDNDYITAFDNWELAE